MRKIASLLGGTTLAAAMVLSLQGSALADGHSGAGIANPPTAVGQPYQVAADYPGAELRPAAPENFSPADRPGSNVIDKIVIHVTQGSFDGSLSWFANPEAGVSAHYTVRSSDGHVAQSVAEKDIAWHAGNWEYNQTSVGIEHEGFVDDPAWFTPAMYDGSARLVADVAKRYGIPIDRGHIIGHNEVPGATHTDPGPNWNWDEFMRLVAQYAG